MTDSKHTPGPWKAVQHDASWWTILNGAWDISHNHAAAPGVVADGKYSAMTPEENAANAARIVACVNGCDGLNPEAYREVVEWMENHVPMHCSHGFPFRQAPVDGCDCRTCAGQRALAKARGEG